MIPPAIYGNQIVQAKLGGTLISIMHLCYTLSDDVYLKRDRVPGEVVGPVHHVQSEEGGREHDPAHLHKQLLLSKL